jgi:myo-inositol 2-dehydrogenase / D-chiro-inositol 1-dehydrogenase
VAALEAGKHVLLEKPMASTIPDCDRIAEAVCRSSRVLTVGHEFRISTQWGYIKRLIDGGGLAAGAIARTRSAPGFSRNRCISSTC